MADFNISYARTAKFEGGYVFDKLDPGGETYKGVSRVHWPTSKIWIIIDAAKTRPNFPKSLDLNLQLQTLIHQFYKENFWDKLHGDDLTDQNVANELYDCAVNMGVPRATTFLQQALNVLNKNGVLYSDISVDGIFGAGTLKTFNVYLSKNNSDILLKVMKILRGNFYVQIMLKGPVQERFAYGWLNRITFFG